MEGHQPIQAPTGTPMTEEGLRLMQTLADEYPGQGFERPDGVVQISAAGFKGLKMFLTIFEHAKAGRLNSIRPDILI